MPTYSFNAPGKLVLESKDDIKKRGLRPTDVGDALALTFAMPVAPKSTSLYPRSRHVSDYNPMDEMYRAAAKRAGIDPSSGDYETEPESIRGVCREDCVSWSDHSRRSSAKLMAMLIARLVGLSQTNWWGWKHVCVKAEKNDYRRGAEDRG